MDAISEALLRQVPFLRRYARALTGSPEAGDDLVGRALPVVLDDPDGYGLGGEGEARRGALYALLNRLQDDAGPRPQPVETSHPMEAALALLPEAERRLFLLVSLEELSFQEAAAVLGVAPDQAHALMADAQEALREALIASIMIVEDDAIIAFDLAETVRGMGHTVCGTAATMESALTTARDCRPTLALMDLRLAHGDSGITTAQRLRQSSELPIIFVTAFGDELTRRGLEHLGPVIRKPFTREQIERAITQAVFAPPREARIPALAAFARDPAGGAV
ncbi:response regulator [Rhodospirillum centenum]|uniref:Response regulator receiver domain protein n=1 Tax=Rhodospirillum centenum (strain ATCC 51521 / SW) TaxID=414684 RepID=B6IWZ3_RHOCS|nr:response regulator [Rhodospirillum centenum]ACJ00817.1 response regulator receiver domain protein [Rhodospirillum centenum SW]